MSTYPPIVLVSNPPETNRLERKAITHLHLTLRLKMHGVLLPIPHIPYVMQRNLFILPLRTTSIFSEHTALRPITHKYKLHTYS
jgi:hypothetical protein